MLNLQNIFFLFQLLGSYCEFDMILISIDNYSNSWFIAKVLSQLSSFLRFGPIPSHNLLKQLLEEKYSLTQPLKTAVGGKVFPHTTS